MAAYNPPIAFFLTFTCYGARLHGDARGSVHWTQASPLLEPLAPDPELERRSREAMKREPILLDAAMRGAVEDGIRELCAKRHWHIHALNVRTNHVHVVVSSNSSADRTLSQVKAFATKMLRERGLVSRDARIWTHHGSTRWLFTQQHIIDACNYVSLGQGIDLPRERDP